MKIRLSELRSLIRRVIEEAIIPEYEPSGGSRGGFSGDPISTWDEGRVMSAWGKHLENWFYLSFIMKSGNANEKMQASKELEICDNKLAFWENHPNWDKIEAGRITSEAAKKWKMPGPVGPARLRAVKSEPSRKPSSSTRSNVTVIGKAPPGGFKRVKHPKYGEGEILQNLEGDKVSVRFDKDKNRLMTFDKKFLQEI